MEVLFKAKRADNGEWIESMTIAKGTIKRKERNFYMEIGKNKWKQIIPETVSQFTGLTDKNGNKIFSGDEFDFKGEKRYIEYIDDRCRYVLTNGKGYDTRNCEDLDCDLIYNLISIGNIHDDGK